MVIFEPSPNDSPMDGTIHPMALEQLAIYQKLANVWVTYRSKEKGRSAIRCKQCKQCLWFLTDRQGHPYIYTPQMKQSLIVAHIRQTHPRENYVATD